MNHRFSLKPAHRFAGLFLLLAGLLIGVTMTDVFGEIVYRPYAEVNTTLSALLLRLVGIKVTAVGNVLSAPGASLHIGRGCTATEATVFVLAALLAFPSRWRRKLVGCLVGVAVLALANLLRIASLFVIRSARPGWYDTAHHELWPVVILLIAGVTVSLLLPRSGSISGKDSNSIPAGSQQ